MAHEKTRHWSGASLAISKIWAFKRVLLEIISADRTGLPEYKKIPTLRPCEDRSARGLS